MWPPPHRLLALNGLHSNWLGTGDFYVVNEFIVLYYPLITLPIPMIIEKYWRSSPINHISQTKLISKKNKQGKNKLKAKK